MGADTTAAASREAAKAVFGEGGACDAAIGAGACAGSCGASGDAEPLFGAAVGASDGGGALSTASTILRARDEGAAASCFASHASLALSSLKSAAHAYSVPSLHISAIEISSEPHAEASSDTPCDTSRDTPCDTPCGTPCGGPCCCGPRCDSGDVCDTPCGGGPCCGGAPTGALLLPTGTAAESGVAPVSVLLSPSSASAANAAAASAPPGPKPKPGSKPAAGDEVGTSCLTGCAGAICEGAFCGEPFCGDVPRGGAICGAPFCGAAPCGGAPRAGPFC